MRTLRDWAAPLVGLLLLLAAFSWLFQVRLGGGDVYPEYSSLRADALGTRALYEALGEVPGMQVERDYRPLAQLGARPRVVLLPGLDWRDWLFVPLNELAALNTATSNGARVVLAFRANLEYEEPDQEYRSTGDGAEKPAPAGPGAKAAKPDKDAAPDKDAKPAKKKPRRPGTAEWEYKELAKEWGVTPKQRWLLTKLPGAQRTKDAPEGLPAQVAWQSELYFSLPADSGWRVLYRRADEPVLLEKKVGRGSLVLVADAYCLSNEAMQRGRATGLLSWLVGDYRRVTFLESPLGVLEGNGIGFLARRYGLGGALALCALLGGLYAWRRLVAFRPVQDEEPAGSEVALTYEPAAGLTGLLRRSLGAAEVLPACLAGWRKGRRGGSPAAAARLEAAWQARVPNQSLSTTYNALVRALKPR